MAAGFVQRPVSLCCSHFRVSQTGGGFCGRVVQFGPYLNYRYVERPALDNLVMTEQSLSGSHRL